MQVIKKHLLFIILILILGGYLGIKAIPENSWDDWGFGSAQTMMSSKHWVEDGFIHSKFLFLPTGYSKVVRYIDEPDLRQHAHGIRTGELVGNRLYYTHYPAGYLLPYATLMKVGFSERFWFRWLAILISLTGLSLMYAAFSLLSTRMIAFLAVLYYAGSTMFLGIADSLANQPIDDLFRFLIIFLSIVAVSKFDFQGRPQVKKFGVFCYNFLNKKLFCRGQNERIVGNERVYLEDQGLRTGIRVVDILIWFLYFALASSSYDSTFFIFVWIVGLDIMMTRKLLWKKWLVFALAPVAAFLVQLLQNIWYLGLHDALLDIYGSFRARANTGPGSGVLEKHIRAVFSPWVYLADLRVRFIVPITIVLFSVFVFLKKRIIEDKYHFPRNEILLLLMFSGFAYPFILVSSGYFPYQARQIAPFISLLLASSTVLVFLIFKDIRKWATWRLSLQVGGVVLLILVSLLWYKQTDRTYAYIREWPNNAVSEDIIRLGQDLKDIAKGQDAVVFRMDSGSTYRYPQASPVLEYYSGMPILSFQDPKDLVDDLEKLKNYSEYQFLPIMITEDNKQEKDVGILLKNINIDYEFFRE